MATTETKYQINFKTHKDGTLINLYADTIKELESQIQDIAMIAALIKTTEIELSSMPAASTVAAAFPAAKVVAAPAPAADGGHVCKHGPMNFRTGEGAKGPWKGWMCASPQGTPKSEKCDTIWVK